MPHPPPQFHSTTDAPLLTRLPHTSTLEPIISPLTAYPRARLDCLDAHARVGSDGEDEADLILAVVATCADTAVIGLARDPLGVAWSLVTGHRLTGGPRLVVLERLDAKGLVVDGALQGQT